MKTYFCISLALAFLMLFCLSCQEEPTSIQGDLSDNQGVSVSALGKPPVNGKLNCMLKVTTPDGTTPGWPVDLPGASAPLWIHYEASGPNPITHAQIIIVYDEDKDGVWSLFISERMRVINLQFDGTQTSVTGDIPWNGEVNPNMSDGGLVFDQYMTENPDLYLFPFSAGDDRSSVNNWGSSNEFGQIPPEARALITPQLSKTAFHLANITIVSTPPKKKYAAGLMANVSCVMPDGSPAIGFYGHGKWVQVYPGGVEGAPQLYSGSLNAGFFDNYEAEGGDGTGSASGISVGPGTYRFYVTMLWSKNKSYRPPEEILYGVVTVP